MTKKTFGNYYLGLDIGTDSLGWAITDPQYEVLRFNGKAMWGIHLFSEGSTAEERRAHRIARRRLERRNQRIKLLQELMDCEVSSVDRTFFDRLKESNLVLEDKKSGQKNSLFNDNGFTDKEYHDKYPTIYHLRADLINTDTKPDIRLVYLALAHIMKHRGHFLYEGLSDDAVPEFKPIFEQLQDKLEELQLIDCRIVEDISKVAEIIQSRVGISSKKEKLSPILKSLSDSDETKATVDELTKALSGGKFSIGKLFGEETAESLEDSIFKNTISLSETKIDDNHDDLESLIGSERIDVLDMLKNIYSWSILSRLLEGSDYISQAKVKQYNQHKQDLALLKNVLKEMNDEEDYNKIFRSNEADAYTCYSGNVKSLKEKIDKRTTQENFCAFLKKILEKHWDDIRSLESMKGYESKIDDMKARIEDGSFMPLQSSKDNSVLPNAVHRAECKAILDNVSRFYPFLSDTDMNGNSVKDKILMLCTFRMPYYIGPVNKNAKTGWVVRRSNEPVRPWNYADVIDIEATSEGFINNRIGFCTYLLGERVMPKQSIAYCRFKLYNEINNIKVNGERISPEMKKSLVEEYFENRECRVTADTIKGFYKKHTGVIDIRVEGLDMFVKSNLDSENKMKNILGDQYDEDLAEDIIRIITIYGDDRKRLRGQLESKYADRISQEKISKLSNLRFKDWGNLSEKFLNGIYSEIDGNEMNILSALKNTNKNLMELLSDEYGYSDKIKEFNKDISESGDVESIIERMRCSPSVKHSIMRCNAILEDVLKITGHPPTKIFIETTREHQESKRTKSRRSDLMDKYAAITSNKDAKELLESLKTTDDARLRGKKLFSYYSQLGRCMYCGKHIDLNDLGNKDQCDMDHIYPQSKVTDDSIRNNMVLTCRSCNANKSNKYPIDLNIRSNMAGFWRMLKDANLISDEKYSRLTRSTEFSEKDLSGFINRQLVETSQTVKAMAEILKSKFGEQSDIVYVKGGNVSQFRQDNSKNKPYYIKCRNTNDYHHAKDAYLNIVVGNVYDVKFTKDILHFVKTGESYNLNEMFSRDVCRNGINAWKAGDDGSILTVDKWMRRDNILYTRAPFKSSGELFDLNVKKAGEGQLPIKDGQAIEKYGGYNKIKGSYFALFEHDDKKKRSRTLVFIPRMIANKKVTRIELEKYASDSMKLSNPSLRLDCIKVDSRLEIDGFNVDIRGTSSGGAGILYLCGEQLSVPFDLIRLFKNVFKYTDKSNSGKNRMYSAKDMDISEEDEVRAFEFLESKLGEKPYCYMSPLKTAKDTLEKNKENYLKLSIDDKAEILAQILKMFHCNAENANLKEIGGPGVAGRLLLSSKISQFNSAYLVNKSPTGLFENRIDLMKI